MKLLALSLLPTALALPQASWPDHGGDHGWPGHHEGHNHPGKHDGVKAAYFLDNDPAGSSIVSLKVGEDGTLSDPIRTSTGGVGSIGTNTTGFPNSVDSLMSQGSVVLSGDVYFPRIARSTAADLGTRCCLPSMPAATPWSCSASTPKTHGIPRWSANQQIHRVNSQYP